jgi:hypothetical protein
MATLLLKLNCGAVLRGKYPLHAIMADDMGVPFDNIADVGFVTKGRDVWCGRGPH